jgi:hypothetical protein
MANKRISALDNLGATPAVGDILPITDIDDPTGSPQGTTKGVTFSDLTNHLATAVSLGNHASLTSAVHGISAFGATLVDDVNAATARTTLGLGTASTQDVGTADGNVVQLSDVAGTVKLPAVDGSQLTNVSGSDSTKLAIASNLSDLNDAATARTNLNLGTAATTASTDYATASHTHAIDDLSDVTITTAQNEDVIKFNGTSFVNGQISVDVDAPITNALRGTTNPHIGAYPNQSFKVIDNPYQSVMIVADEAGNLKLLNSLGVNNIAVGFSVVEDGTEPDIEVVSGSETYSVISGDSDSKAVNGLPLRQGFNNPDIGANPAPILISGGSIA